MVLDQLVDLVIRPPRAEYTPETDLLGPVFEINGRTCKRHDIQLVNKRGHVLQCSHYRPDDAVVGGKALPCVIYCHGNSGCMADASDAVLVLLPLNITVLGIDFSGSGRSQGSYVSLGKFEVEDLETAIDFLRTEGLAQRVGLWGRSMGAVTSLLYAAKDPTVAGIVADSPFSNLNSLILELVDFHRIPVPRALGDKNKITFAGDHNSPRPGFFFDSVAIFFHNVLEPPAPPPPLHPHHLSSSTPTGSYSSTLPLPREAQMLGSWPTGYLPAQSPLPEQANGQDSTSQGNAQGDGQFATLEGGQGSKGGQQGEHQPLPGQPKDVTLEDLTQALAALPPWASQLAMADLEREAPGQGQPHQVSRSEPPEDDYDDGGGDGGGGGGEDDEDEALARAIALSLQEAHASSTQPPSSNEGPKVPKLAP